MSSKVDLELARWLIKSDRLPKEKAEALLKAYRKELKSGEAGAKKKNWLSWLVSKGEFDLESAKQIQKAFKDRNAEPEPEPSSATETEEVEDEAPVVSFDDDGDAEGPSFSSEEASDESGDAANEDGDSEEEDEDEEDGTVEVSNHKKKCGECFGENDPDAKECTFCGAHLKAVTFIDCVFCGYKEPVKSKSCGNCGCHPISGKPTAKTQKCKTCKAPLKPTQAICLSCGTPVVRASATWWGLAGRAMTLLQFVLVFGALCGFRFIMNEDGGGNETKTVVEIRDPWAGLPPRGLPPGLESWKLDDDNRAILEKALEMLEEGKVVEAETYLEDEEDQIGIPGLVLLGLSYFHQNKGAELISLSKALPSNRPLKTMAALWRTWQARLTFRSFEWAKAHRIMEPVLKGPNPTSEQWFWGGIMAWGEGDTKTAGQRFSKAVAGENAPRETHLFLYLIHAKNKEGSGHLQKWIETSEDPKAAEELVEDYR